MHIHLFILRILSLWYVTIQCTAQETGIRTTWQVLESVQELSRKVDDIRSSKAFKQNVKAITVLKQLETFLKMTELETRMESLLSGEDDGYNKQSCKEDWFSFGESCYFFSKGKVTWKEGRLACIKMGGDYVKITNDTEFYSIAGLTDEEAWIGLNDLLREGEFQWASDGSVAEGISHWWHGGHPNNAGGFSHCVHYTFEDGRPSLKDKICTAERTFICEM